MDTTEHTEVGNAILFNYLNNNPYLRLDNKGILHLIMQRFSSNNLPQPMKLELSAGEIVAMSGDYFTEEDWSMDLNLPQCKEFENGVKLGQFLIRRPVKEKETAALITAYNNLAAEDVSRKEIEQIYSINDTNYIPFSETLNFYVQQLMFTIWVKDYGEMLLRNQTHFTPWSVRVYILGHQIALRYANLSYELHAMANDSSYQSKNQDIIDLQQHYAKTEQDFTKDLVDLAHRYHAQAYAMELYTFHYYSDHFAAGHMSMMGDMRVLLPQRFGTWGSILVNSMHDELNRVGIFSVNPYNNDTNHIHAPSCAQGDGDFDSPVNEFNRFECIAGMTASVREIDTVLKGSPIPHQSTYAGIMHMRDIDLNCRQPQPLLVQIQDKIYQRTNLTQIKILSPSEYDNIRVNPEAHGYEEVKSSWDAFVLVAKIRLFPYLYNSELVPLSDEQLAQIKTEEKQRSPQRLPIPDPIYTTQAKANIQNWRTKPSSESAMEGLKREGLFSRKSRSVFEEEKSFDTQASFSI